MLSSLGSILLPPSLFRYLLCVMLSISIRMISKHENTIKQKFFFLLFYVPKFMISAIMIMVGYDQYKNTIITNICLFLCPYRLFRFQFQFRILIVCIYASFYPFFSFSLFHFLSFSFPRRSQTTNEHVGGWKMHWSGFFSSKYLFCILPMYLLFIAKIAFRLHSFSFSFLFFDFFFLFLFCTKNEDCVLCNFMNHSKT